MHKCVIDKKSSTAGLCLKQLVDLQILQVQTSIHHQHQQDHCHYKPLEMIPQNLITLITCWLSEKTYRASGFSRLHTKK